MKYPIGIQDFGKIRNDGYVYLDKTDLIYDLVHNGNIYFLSRPRRFGKSLLISTLECYFQGKKELFKGLAIEQLEKEWKQYPVFHIDFNGKDFTQAGELEKTLQTFVEPHPRPHAGAVSLHGCHMLERDHPRARPECLLRGLGGVPHALARRRGRRGQAPRRLHGHRHF